MASIPRLAPAALLLVLAASPARAQGVEEGKYSITPFLGGISDSDIVSGPVTFSDGDTDFISLEPGSVLMLGLELDMRLKPKLHGNLMISYASGAARYFEGDNRRADASVHTTRIQPGVIWELLRSGKLAVGAGGGLTIARVTMDDLVWNDRPVSARGTALGLYGAGELDVRISQLVSLHLHLVLEASRMSFGDLEDELAFADGEAGAEVDHDTRTSLAFALGVRFTL